MLHSRVLRYLDEVVRVGSIRGAAERLHVASSAINRHILELEESIGEPLFERLPRGLRPTPAGEVLIAHIRRTLQEYSQVEAEIRDLKALRGGEVIMATMNGLASSIIPQAAAAFCARHPNVRITIRAMFIRDIIEAVADGEADLGFAFNLPGNPQLDVMAKMDTRLGAVVSPEHPLAGSGPVALALCAAYPLIFADRSMVIHGIVAEGFARAGLEVEPTFRTNSVEAMKWLAASGEGVAFLTRFDVAEEKRSGILTYLPLRDRAMGRNVLSLVRRDKRNLGLAAAMFAEDLLRLLRDTAE